MIKETDIQKGSLTQSGDPRGYIQPGEFRELWFHTGSRCNLQCPFCFEESSPTSDRVQQLSFDEVKTLIDEAIGMGVQQFGFTGGEPFVNKDILKMLDYALEYKPCLVLTNGTTPLINKFAKLAEFREKPNKLSFRISIDSPDAAEHDRNRGTGSFEKAVKALKMLFDAGFEISVAGRCESRRNEYKDLFAKLPIPEDIPLVFFPELYNMEDTPEITENCMTQYFDELSRSFFMCNYSKMVLKINGEIKIYACTLVDDDPSYDLGEDLRSALKKRIFLKHKRCFLCFSSGVKCGG